MFIYSQFNDNKLFQLIVENDESAFSELYKRYKDRLFDFSLKMTLSYELAQDIVHDVFLKIWENKSKFEGKEMFSSYLFTMVHNLIIDDLRRKAKLKQIYNEYELSNLLIDNNTPESYTIFYNINCNIHKAINKLPKRQKQIFLLHKIEKLKHNEIAELLKLSRSTVENTFGKSLATLRSLLK